MIKLKITNDNFIFTNNIYDEIINIHQNTSNMPLFNTIIKNTNNIPNVKNNNIIVHEKLYNYMEVKQFTYNKNDKITKIQGKNIIIECIYNDNILINIYIQCTSKYKQYIILKINEILYKLNFKAVYNKPYYLTYNDISTVMDNNDYSITDKIDGNRMFLFITIDDIYLLSNETIIYITFKHSVKNHINLSIIDCEYVDTMIYCFDILFYNGINVAKYNLIERHNYLNQIVTAINSKNIIMKTFYYPSEKSLCNIGYEIMEKHKLNLPYKIDGLIYTPLYGEYYDGNKKIFKWKPLYDMTMDFLVIIEDELILLICSSSFKQFKLNNKNYGITNANALQQFITSLSISTQQLFKEYNNGSMPYIYKIITNDDITYNKKITSNKIYEIYYNITSVKWTIYRERKDKTKLYENSLLNNEFMGPNSISNIKYTMKYLYNPIPNKLILCNGHNKNPNITNKNTIINTSHNIKNNNKHVNNKINRYYKENINGPDLLKNLKRFHHKIKSDLYRRTLNKHNTLLEIGGGRGGDLSKLKQYNLNIILTNIDKPGLLNVEKRAHNLNMKVYTLYGNSSTNLTSNIKNKLNKLTTKMIDVVSIQFAFHYFLKSHDTLQNTYNNINTFLKKNGYVILTFLDGLSVYNLLKSIHQYEFKTKNNDVILKITQQYPDNEQLQELGQAIDVYSLSFGERREYLVNYEYIKTFFEKHNYKIIDSKIFKYISHKNVILDYGELEYSNLHRYVILQKNAL